MAKQLLLLLVVTLIIGTTTAQTTLTEAENFHVKTVYGESIYLFPILDDENQIVVIDFFSTTCGPCQDYAPDFQACYEKFGYNEGNVYFMGINWGNDNTGVIEFDSIFGLTFPSVSGSQGGGNIVYGDYDIQSYPSVIVITPDHTIVEQYIWYPTEENITNAVIAAGGLIVGNDENKYDETELKVFPLPVQNNGTIEFELQKSEKINLRIFNLIGQQVYISNSQSYAKGKVQITFPVNELENGYYFVKVDSDMGPIATTRISVSH